MPARAALDPPVAAPWRRRALVVVGAAGLLGTLLVSPAAGAPPSPDQVAAQRAEADQLGSELVAAEQAGDDAQARLEELTAAANAALEVYQLADKARWEAEADHWEQSERLDAAEHSLRSQRGELGRWVARTYREGPAAGAWRLEAFLGADSTDDLGQRLALLEVVARSQGRTVAELQDAAAAQTTATVSAEETARRVLDATLAAAAAKEASERLVAEQAAQVQVLRDQEAQTREATEAAEARADRLTAARAMADAALAAEAQREAARQAEEQRRSSPATGAASARSSGAVPSGGCQGQDVSWFANGQIPAAALCPLWGAPGHLLRADAAAAFDAMAEAWAADTGRPLCVTDSYRGYDGQVRLYAAKPHLAAVPGTSNHGWGVALDLCGGIQKFGTPQHRWMQLNASRFGWFHPAWARQGGSRPEAWHWEFAG